MYETTIKLLAENTRSYDQYGNETITRTERTVYAMPRGVYNAEFYNASQVGLKPSITFVMANRIDYEGESLVEYDGKIYKVIRTDWTAQKDSISLVCEVYNE